MAAVDRHCICRRRHIVLQPELPYQPLIRKHIELHRSVLTSSGEKIVHRVGISALVRNRERAGLIFTVWVECRHGGLPAAVVHKFQGGQRTSRSGPGGDSRHSPDMT